MARNNHPLPTERLVRTGRGCHGAVKNPVLSHVASSIEKAVLMAFSRGLIVLNKQPHIITSPVEVRVAPAGKRSNIIGAVNGTSLFPVANRVRGELVSDHPLRRPVQVFGCGQGPALGRGGPALKLFR